MRVLILSQYFWPESFRITAVAATLKEAGCEVLVLTGQPNYPKGEIFDGYSALAVSTEAYAGLKVFRVPVIPRGRGSALRLVLNYASFVISAMIFGPWLLRRQRIDSIFVYAPSPILQAIPAIWLARLKRARLVTWVQDLWPESLSATGFVKNDALLRAVAVIVRWIYRKNDCLLAQSEAFVAPIQLMAPNTPVRYYPNPGDLLLSNVAEDNSPVEFPDGFNVVFTGNLGTVQALDTVLQAAMLLKEERDISFVLVGSGSRSAWLEAEVDRLGLENVRLTGRFPLSAMPAIMDRASALLVSLIRSPIMAQTIPGKVQVYLAAGKPIIAALDGEGARIVNEACAGVTCLAEDAEALANAVKQLRDMPEEQRSLMGKNGVRFYQENYEPRMLASRLLDILTETKRRHR